MGQVGEWHVRAPPRQENEIYEEIVDPPDREHDAREKQGFAQQRIHRRRNAVCHP